jgi:hypothetical protein
VNTSNVGSNVKSFPKYIQDQLDEAWNKSTRHESWLSLAYQMVGERTHSDEEIFDALREWISDADKLDSDLWRAIRGAHRRNPTPATRGISGSYDRERKIIQFRATNAPIVDEEIPTRNLSRSISLTSSSEKAK